MTLEDLIVDAGDARIRVAVAGQGDPVVVLHGFTGSARAMAPLIDQLGDHRVIAPDLVGHGGSSVPEDPGAYSVEAMVRHVLAVADALGCRTFHLVGYSMGGRVALTLGCRFGVRLRSLALIGATAGLADEPSRAERRRHDEDLARQIEADPVRFVDRWMENPLFAGQARLGEEFLEGARAQRLANDPTGLAASLRAAGTGSMQPLHDVLGGCVTPTLLVVGERDEKFLRLAIEMSGSLPEASVAVIPEAGHSAHVEQPAEVADRIRDFVAGVDRP